jgi:hypothetical protein
VRKDPISKPCRRLTDDEPIHAKRPCPNFGPKTCSAEHQTTRKSCCEHICITVDERLQFDTNVVIWLGSEPGRGQLCD